jgi:hypothetical protein
MLGGNRDTEQINHNNGYSFFVTVFHDRVWSERLRYISGLSNSESSTASNGVVAYTFRKIPNGDPYDLANAESVASHLHTFANLVPPAANVYSSAYSVSRGYSSGGFWPLGE